MLSVEVLLATYNRPESLILTLAGLAAQSRLPDRVIVADQGNPHVGETPVVLAARRILEERGVRIEWHDRPQISGIPEQRDFLLRQATADAVLYLDDDVYMGSPVLERLVATLTEEQCGFVGAFPAGLSHRDDVRPQQQIVEFWEGPVQPEIVIPETPPAWNRWQLHRAANVLHAAQRLVPPGEVRRYKVAWVASCILYDRRKLEAVGGFGFWKRLPRYSSGEEVLVQLLLMRRWGGCALLPSDTYYTQVPTTVLNEAGSVDGHALSLLDEMIAHYTPPTSQDDAGTPTPATSDAV